MSVRHTLLAALTVGAMLLRPAPGFAENKIPEECKSGGYFIGCQAWTWNHFTVFEAIEKTAQSGGKIIEFFPGQKLSLEEPNVVWDHNASTETIQKVKDKLAEFHIKAVNYGVVGIPNDPAGARKVFEFAKALGLRAITTESVDAIDVFEPLVKEYDIMVAFHDHPKQPNNPNYPNRSTTKRTQEPHSEPAEQPELTEPKHYETNPRPNAKDNAKRG